MMESDSTYEVRLTTSRENTIPLTNRNLSSYFHESQTTPFISIDPVTGREISGEPSRLLQ